MTKKLELIGAMYPWTDSIINLRDGLSKKSNEDLEIDINSPGGIVTLGIELFNKVRRYPGNVKMNIVGIAASMATYFALAGDEIIVEDNSMFMIHNAHGGAVGDKRTAKSWLNNLESMDNLIALRYSEKTGKSVDSMLKKMDEETLFIGKDIKTFGFADTLIKSKKLKEKAELKAHALIEVQTCFNEMKKYEVDESDLDKIAAHIDRQETYALLDTTSEAYGKSLINNPNDTNNSAQSAEPPDNKGNIKSKEKTMSLKELMATDPGIKAEVEALIIKNYDQGKTDGKALIEGRIKAAKPFIGKTEYPEAITSLAVKVVTGEEDPTALKGAVVAFDAMKQQSKSDEAGGEQEDDTPPGSPDALSEDGSVSNEAEYQASIKKAKGGK